MYHCMLRTRNDPKFSAGQICANSADPDQIAPSQGIHCLPFRLHLLDALLNGKILRVITAFFRVSELFWFLRYTM